MKKKLLILYLLSLSLAVMGQRGPSGPSYDSSRSYVSERVYLNKEGTRYVDNVTYLDGFGRTLQETRVKASPGGTADLIVPHAYGVLGRKEKEYLPFAKAGNNGAFVADAYSANNWTPAYGAADASYACPATSRTAHTPTMPMAIRRKMSGKVWNSATMY